MADSLQFGVLLRSKRHELDWSQSELARLAGCAPITVRKLERGERRPSRSLAERLALVLRLLPTERDQFVAAARQPDKPDRFLHPWNNLPAASPLFLGRETELHQLQAWIRAPHVRLITLVGIGGAGKTRLALHAAGQDALSFPDGVCFVAIPSSDTSLIAAIATALSFALVGSDPPLEQLRSYLRQKRILFVIDGFEQIIRQSEDLLVLLHGCHHARFIVTSREYLNTPDEWALEIQGLAYAPPDLHRTEPERYAAPHFFLLRVKQMLPDFTLDPADREAVHAICAQLRGVPLALELAASWIRILSMQQIAEAIRTQPDILQTESDSYPARQRSLRAVFESSWMQLSPEMQAMLCRLSVFQNGFTAESAIAVTGGNLHTLRRLRDHCLIQRNPQGRNELHALIRQFVEEKLAQDRATLTDARTHHAEQRHCCSKGWRLRRRCRIMLCAPIS
jgi:transcriptional regulator with XRE-family HTH domain